MKADISHHHYLIARPRPGQMVKKRGKGLTALALCLLP